MNRTAIFLTETQVNRLRSLAMGRTISELIREAIDEYLNRKEKAQQ